MNTLNFVTLRELCDHDAVLYEWVCVLITNDFSWGDTEHAMVLRATLGFSIDRRRHDRDDDDGMTVEINTMYTKLWELPDNTYVSL